MTAEPRGGFFQRITGGMFIQDDDSEQLPQSEEEQSVATVATQVVPDAMPEDVEEEEISSDEEYSDEDQGKGEEQQEGQLTVDVFQDEQNVIVQSTIAGVSADDLDVSITNDMVTIRGERRRAFTVETKDYFYQECYWGPFSRSIILPVEIDPDRAEAKIKNGILTIRIPKANAVVTRKLKVRAS